MEARKLYRHKFSSNIAAYSEPVIPKEVKARVRLAQRKKRHAAIYDESLSRKLFCSHCKREFIGKTLNGFSYPVDDDCGGSPDDLVFMDYSNNL